MEKMKKIKQLSRQIVELAKTIPAKFEIEAGVQFEPIPKPVIKLYAKIRMLHLLRKNERQEKYNENRKRNDKRLCHNDEGAFKRDST